MKSYFATHIEQKKLKISSKDHAELKRTALKLPEIDALGVKWSKKNYPNGYTSYGSLSSLHQQFSVFDRLKGKLDIEVRSFCRNLKLNADQGRIELSSLWVNLMPKGCYHAFHFHPNSVVSGTYYVEVPIGGSPLRIEDPRAGLFMASPPRLIQLDLKPRAGEVILFESWMRHEVPPHHGKETRISISFNYDWIDR
jgi:uncharacterized protein (TIGR02466 family)